MLLLSHGKSVVIAQTSVGAAQDETLREVTEDQEALICPPGKSRLSGLPFNTQFCEHED